MFPYLTTHIYHSFILPLQFAFSEIPFLSSQLQLFDYLHPIQSTRGIPRIPYNFAAAHSHPNST